MALPMMPKIAINPRGINRGQKHGYFIAAQSTMEEQYYTTQEGDRMIASLLLVAAACIINIYWRRPKRLQQAPVPPNQQAPATRRTKRIWCREWLMRRTLHGNYHQLLEELNNEDRRGFKNFLRIEPELFAEMLQRLSPRLAKSETNMRQPLSVGLKLAVTLRFLASGNSYTSLQYSFRVSKSAICRFVPQVCRAIIDIYKPEVLKCPRTPEEWNNVATAFSKRWNYHNCGGALDGKHVAIKKPINGGSLFYNYKKFHSIVLMALADANYKFLYVDIGAEGGAGDGGTWFKCTLNEAIEEQRVGFPEDSPLPNDDTPMPFHIIADDAFALKPWLMKPYSHQSQVHHEKIYSYRLSRARRVVENAFGLLQARMRVFGTTMHQQPKVVKIITMCACVMHNLILDRTPFPANEVDHEDGQHNLVPGAWREEANIMERLYNPRGQNYTAQAKAIRDYLAAYYTSEAGAVPWQERIVYPRGRPRE